MQMSKTRHSAYDRVAVHVNKRTKCVRLEQTHQDNGVPEWYTRHEAYFEHQKPTVCGRIIPSTSRLHFRSQTGGETMTFRKGAVQSLSKKQKLNTRSSTKAKLVGADDIATQILWMKHFMEAQGYMIKDNILHQDNKSTFRRRAKYFTRVLIVRLRCTREVKKFPLLKWRNLYHVTDESIIPQR